MSKRRVSARVVGVVVMVSAAVSLLSPAARADSPKDVCAAFPHRQTYVAEEGMFRAPAWHYDDTVTVVYETSFCTAEVTDAGNYVLSIRGDATIHEGSDATGLVLDERPFSSSIRSSASDGNLGWPIDWWACFDGSFSYVWRIEDVYTFLLTAADGRWVMLQRDEGSGESSGSIVDACHKH